MAYLCHLVNLGVFRKIKVNFLLVGHTHENIDQMFSRFSIALRQHDAFTLEQLMEVAHNCLQQQPEVVKVDGSFNWTSWFEGYMEEFHDLSFNHAFKVQKVDGVANLFSRKYGSGPRRTWQASALNILPLPPSGEPDVAPLVALKPEDLESAKLIRDKLRETLHADEYLGAVEDYWASQCTFQQALHDNLDNTDPPELPFSFPEPCTYVAPAPMTRDDALEGVSDRLRELVDPGERPVFINYGGAKSAVQRQARQLLLDDRFAEAMENITCFDTEKNGNQLLISWALGEETDRCWFTVEYTFEGKKLYSDPLHLQQIQSIDVANNKLTLKFLMPKDWTKKEDRFIAIQKAGKPATWMCNQSSPVVDTEFNADEYVVAAEKLEGDDFRCIRKDLYHALQSKLIARNIKIVQEQRNTASCSVPT